MTRPDKQSSFDGCSKRTDSVSEQERVHKHVHALRALSRLFGSRSTDQLKSPRVNITNDGHATNERVKLLILAHMKNEIAVMRVALLNYYYYDYTTLLQKERRNRPTT
ncbi:hypothetical protein EVAR_14974_1 [Eumeta japonica]|uniref:Uncharacterized protein n=1 Tax=Eumeta variegata TaxID=151549 RepID=A0A4C1XMV8_EUMVA|nr:hypothetical protein EVAR_14974_1 [Eumeta japonica]